MTRAEHVYTLVLWHRFSARTGRTPEGVVVQDRQYHRRCARNAASGYHYLRDLERFARAEVARLQDGGAHAPWLTREEDVQRWQDQLQDLD
jgi:hypothetical protein